MRTTTAEVLSGVFRPNASSGPTGAAGGWLPKYFLKVPGLSADYPEDVVLSFARTVAAPGSRAMLITRENKRAGWCHLEETAGRPFCVEVPRWLLALDSDKPEQRAAVFDLTCDMQQNQLAPVLVHSGRPGHDHVFCVIEVAAVFERYAARATLLGLDVRSPGQRIRPPLSPHRLPDRFPRLVFPTDLTEALAALTPPTSRARPLTLRMATLLRDGTCLDSNYQSRSEAIQALALAACNAEWSENGSSRP